MKQKDFNVKNLTVILNKCIFLHSLLFLALINTEALANSYTTEYWYTPGGLILGEIGADPDGDGPRHHSAVRYTYDNAANLTKTEHGSVASVQSRNTNPDSWQGFIVFKEDHSTYDSWGRKETAFTKRFGEIYTLTHYSYDQVGRVLCETKRMNASAFESLPSSACALGDKGEFGHDRITRYSYDGKSQITEIKKAYLITGLQQSYVKNTYKAKGLVETTEDAKGNMTYYEYDNLGRLYRTYFPSKTTAGQYNLNDYEEYGYDNNGNITSLKKRDGRWIYSNFDSLNRIYLKDVPGDQSDVNYTYNNFNLQTTAKYTDSNLGIETTYNGFGWITESTSSMSGVSRSISYQYDDNGNRTRVTHPDNTYFAYTYD